MINKNDVIRYYFEDIFQYLLIKYKIAPATIPCIIYCIIIYFSFIRKHKKGDKYSIKAKFYIGTAVILALGAIYMQILVLTGYLK